MVAFELMHTLKMKSNGEKGWLALKLDMSKAYDRVEWCFVEAMMHRLGFPVSWINLVMKCITTARFSCLINGVPYGDVVPQRGLRQGCPLSPYIFLLCAQGLSALFQQAERVALIQGLSCSRFGPRISHLFFADDSLVFCRAKQEECDVVKQILSAYELASGQLINFQKSAITFSPNVKPGIRDDILHCFGLAAAQAHDRYLGLPTMVGREKKKTFEIIKEKVWQKLQLWKGRLFSAGGREILIKAVASAIPTYTMSLFRLPISLCEDIQSMIARYWWGGDEKNKKIHWWSWEKLCRPKMEGGLGFKDFSTFNQALLAKQGWRLIQNPSSLARRVLKAKYFPSFDFLNAKIGHRPSFVWRSLLWGKELLNLGIRWMIGDGCQVSVFDTPWLPRPFSFKLVTATTGEFRDWKVIDLIDPITKDWDSEKINRVCWPIDREAILKIPTGVSQVQDRLVWHHTPSGLYTVNSGYRTARDFQRDTGGSDVSSVGKWWKFLWGRNVPSKVKLCVWRAFNEILPTTFNLAHRGISIGKACIRCHSKYEDSYHALFECPASAEVWKLSAFWPHIAALTRSKFDMALLKLWETIRIEEMEILCVILWMIWTDRNQVLYGDKVMDAKNLLERAGRFLFEYHSAQVVIGRNGSSESSPKPSISWSPPAYGHLKLNTDAAVVSGLDYVCVGGLVRDHEGEVLGAFSKRIRSVSDVLLAECLAIRTGLVFAMESGLRVSTVESDALNAVQAIIGSDILSSIGTVVEDINFLLKSAGGATCCHVSRLGNKAAHSLAKYALLCEQDCYWMEEVPPGCIAFVQADKAMF